MKRVLYLLRYYPTLTETFVVNEIAALCEQGWPIHVASMGTRADGLLQDALPPAPVLRVPRRPLRGRLRPATRGMRWLATHQRPKDVARLPWLAARAVDFDHLHVHFAGEAAEWAHALHLDLGIPYTVMVHAVDLFKPRPSLVEVLRGAHQVLTVARHHAEHLATLGVQARVVRCGPRLPQWAGLPLPGDPLRALFIGRNVPKKGLDLLLQAWALRRPEGTLRLLTDASPPRLPSGVSAPGLVSPTALRQELAQANLIVLPARVAPDGDRDGVPLVLMEALAASRPVLTTPVAGIPELVDETVGWLVPPDDLQSLSAALTATTPAERARRGARGPERLLARGFTLTAQVQELTQSWD